MAGEVEPIILTFSAGINSRRRPADISIQECSSGENFDLETQVASLRTRPPYDLVATATNGAEIRGYAQLIKRDGTVSSLIQAGGTVYEWDGSSTFTQVGTVSSSAQLRGLISHNFILDEKVLITDLQKAETVKTWDGTTFEDLQHNLSTTFKAKFCRVDKERAFFANVTTDTTELPHMMVGSAVEDSTDLSTSVKPSSAVGPDAAFFLLSPDLKVINGMELAFGQFMISTREGRIHVLKGTSSLDFEFESFYDGSSAEGDEAMTNIGNDVLIGGLGKIESLSGVFNFGDVETNDVSLPIQNLVEDITTWRLAYEPTKQQVFCFPDQQDNVWVLHKSLVRPTQGEIVISPWSKWTSTAAGLSPATVIQMRDPVNKKNSVCIGDNFGQIFRLNGLGALDGGTDAITVTRTSKLITIPVGAELFDVRWWCDYRLQFETTITLDFIWGGVEYPTDTLEFTIPSANFAVYDGAAAAAGDAMYNGDFFYSNRFQTRIRRQINHTTGRGSYLQVKVSYSGEAEIEEIGIEIRAAA